MTFPFDFAAVDSHETVSLVVEAKALLHTTTDWASEMRARIGSRSSAMDASAFLLATPDRLYFWLPASQPNDAPDAVLDGESIFHRYFARARVREDRKMDGQVFEDIVGWWLFELAEGLVAAPEVPAFAAAVEALRGARVAAGRAA